MRDARPVTQLESKPSSMINRRTIAYRVRGIATNDELSREIVRREDPRMRAFLTNDLSEFARDVDRGTAIANLC